MNTPVISIILPSLRPAQLKLCLASIERYTEGIAYEVVVISPFDMEPNPKVVHVKEKTGAQGIYKAVASGYEQAKGEYIIHIPDDTRTTPSWATNMLAFMRPHDDEIFEGNFRHFDARGERLEPGYYGKLFAPFICIRRDKADRIGGLMDRCYSSFFGDADLSLRVWHNGGSVETCPNAWIYHADCNDEVHNISNSSYFLRDRETFTQRWHHIYARNGESKDFYASKPIAKKPPSPELPPEECTKLYVSIKRRDWESVKKVLISDSSTACLYPEGFPVLYRCVMEMLQSTHTPHDTLSSVLEWLSRKGYTPSTADAEPAEKRLMSQWVRSAIINIARALPVRKGKGRNQCLKT